MNRRQFDDGFAQRLFPFEMNLFEFGIGRREAALGADFERVFAINQRSTGGPTVMLLRIVESIEISAYLVADSSVVESYLMPRSRIGRPYLVSPICKKGASVELQSGLPCG